MARLPSVGGDSGTWGTVLNEFLEVSHNGDGTLKASAAQSSVFEFQLAGAVSEGATSFTLNRAPSAAAHHGWFLIDPWTTSAELWRPTSISGTTVTCSTSAVETLTASNISFTASTKKINGQPEAISKFFPGERIIVTGSSSNNGTYTVAAYPTDGSYDGTYIKTVESLVDESAGASITVRRARRAHANGATVLFVVGPISVTSYGAKASGTGADAAANRAAIQRALDDAYYAAANDIYVPGFLGGRYVINGPLYIEKLTHLRGPHQKSAVIAADSTFATWNDDVAMIQTRRNGLVCRFANGGNDRYYISSLGLDGGNTAYAKSTGYSVQDNMNGTALLTSGGTTVSVHATLIKQNGPHTVIVYRALAGGTGGNSIRIAHVNDGANQPLTVTASGNDITVHLATNGSSVVTSTANDVIAAVNTDPDSNGLVNASLAWAGYQKFNTSGSALVDLNDGTGVVGTFALTSLAAGSAPFASGDVGRSIYLGVRYGARTVTGYTNAYTVTVSGSNFANTVGGVSFALSPVNGLLGSYNQTAVLTDMRIESCPGYAFAATGCQEFSVRNLMTLFSGVHRRLFGVQFAHFIDCNMEHTRDAYVTFESDAVNNINRANHFIGGHIEDTADVDYFRAEGAYACEGLTIIDFQATTGTGSRVLRFESTLPGGPSYSIIGWMWSGVNDGPTFVSDAKRGYDIPMTDFTENNQPIVDHFFVRGGNIQANRNVVAKTSAYTMRVADKFCAADATGGAFTVTLPPVAALKGLDLTVKRMNSGANPVSVDPNGSEQIDGSSTAVSLAAQYDRITVMSDGAQWLRID